MSCPAYQTLSFSVALGCARIALARAHRRNAINQQMLDELSEAMWTADRDGDVRVILLCAEGPDFCAGFDIAEYPQARSGAHVRGLRSMDDDIWELRRSQRLQMAIRDVGKPVIARVHGRCLAGGTDVALLCDIILCSTDSVWGYPQLRVSGSPPNHMWLYHVGPQWAKRMLLTGDLLTGRDAARIGLVVQAYEPHLLDEAVDALLARVAQFDSDHLRGIKRLVNAGMDLMGAATLQPLAAENDARAHLARSRREFGAVLARDGMRAAVQSRDGRFGPQFVDVS